MSTRTMARTALRSLISSGEDIERREIDDLWIPQRKQILIMNLVWTALRSEISLARKGSHAGEQFLDG